MSAKDRAVFIRAFYRLMFRMIFEAVRKLNLKTLVMSFVGAGVFAKYAPPRFKDDIWVPELKRAVKLYGKGIDVKFMGVAGDENPLGGALVGRFPALLDNLDDLATAAIVNAWDPLSLPGNGNERDNSLDGWVGRTSSVASSGSSMTNPWLLRADRYIPVASDEEDQVFVSADAPRFTWQKAQPYQAELLRDFVRRNVPSWTGTSADGHTLTFTRDENDKGQIRFETEDGTKRFVRELQLTDSAWPLKSNPDNFLIWTGYDLVLPFKHNVRYGLPGNNDAEPIYLLAGSSGWYPADSSSTKPIKLFPDLDFFELVPAGEGRKKWLKIRDLDRKIEAERVGDRPKFMLVAS